MQLEFIELKTQTAINSGELRARARQFPGRVIDLRYVVRKADDEVAFLWYNTFPTEFYLVIYELFVAARFRHQGIGSALIHHEITKEQLIAWYEKRGFTKMAGDRGIYLKNDFIGQSYPMPKT
jgi:GNAT superfamily N-acetyltransferase